MSLTPIFDAVLADADCDIWLAGNIFPRPTLVADWVREALHIELLPWQRDFLDSRYRAKVRAEFPLAEQVAKGLGVPFIWASSAA